MKTLWSQSTAPDEAMLAYTVGEDRHWDGYLLEWDVIGTGITTACADGTDTYLTSALNITDASLFADQDLRIRFGLWGSASTSSASTTSVNAQLNVKRPDQSALCVSSTLSQGGGTFGNSVDRYLYITILVPNSCLVDGTRITFNSPDGLEFDTRSGMSWIITSLY